MSNMYAVATLPLEWVFIGGGLGGALNAALSSNLRLLPRWAQDARIGVSHVVRVGLLVSSAVGATASVALLWVIWGIADLDVRTGAVPLRLIAASLFVGFMTARGLTSEVDKMLLRLAVRSAAAAPAAHPHIAQALDHAPPYTVYQIAVELTPRGRSTPPGQVHVSRRFTHDHAERSPFDAARFDKAHPQRM